MLHWTDYFYETPSYSYLSMYSEHCILDRYEYHTYQETAEDTSSPQIRRRCPLCGTLELKSTTGESISLVVHEVLGMGTGSIAYLAEIDGEYCVAKQLYPELLNNESLIKGTSSGLTVLSTYRAQRLWRKRKHDFLRSSRLQEKLSRIPDLAGYIQPVLGIYSAGDTLCMVSGSFVGYSWEKQQECSINELVEIIINIAQLIQCINEHGLLVVDIKPSNFVVSTDSSGRVSVKLIDFGSISRRQPWTQYKYSSETAPKEYKSTHKKNVGTWSEVYCVVAMFSDRLFGHHRVKSIYGDLSELCRHEYRKWVYDHHSVLLQIITRGLDDNVSTRFQTCRELLMYMNMLT